MSDPRNMANSLGGITEYENEALDTLIQHYDVLKTNNKFGAWRQQDVDICKEQNEWKTSFKALDIWCSKRKKKHNKENLVKKTKYVFTPRIMECV